MVNDDRKTIPYKDIAPYRRNKNIFISNVEDTVLDKVLRKGSDRLLGWAGQQCRPVLSEQIIEYPLLFQHLDPPPSRILYFGCNEGLLPIQLCALGYTVTGMGLAPYPFTHPNFNFVQADILNWTPPPVQFDMVTAISSIEHVGASYGPQMDQNGDWVVMQKLFQVLKPGGKLIFTVPAGQPRVERGMRIYDAEHIYRLAPKILTMRFFAKPSRFGAWQETTPEQITSLVYDDYQSTSPAQGVAFVVASI